MYIYFFHICTIISENNSKRKMLRFFHEVHVLDWNLYVNFKYEVKHGKMLTFFKASKNYHKTIDIVIFITI